MANYLQQLLGAKEPLFSAGLAKLERATGARGVDTKLIGDIHERAYAAMRQLGLHPADTTSKELWMALHGKYPASILSNTDYVGLVTVDGVVSFNANDVKRNRNRSFSDRTCDAMRQALVHELQSRYQATGRDTSGHIEALVQDAGMTTFNLQANRKVEKREISDLR